MLNASHVFQPESIMDLLLRLKDELSPSPNNTENEGTSCPSHEIIFSAVPSADISKTAAINNSLSNGKPEKSCSCTNCCNRKSISNLINQFENQKTNMINELDSLKSEFNELEVHTAEMNEDVEELVDKIGIGSNALAKLVGGESVAVSECTPLPSYSSITGAVDVVTSSGGHQQNVGAGDYSSRFRLSQSFQNDLNTLQKYRTLFTEKLRKRSISKNRNEEETQPEHQEQQNYIEIEKLREDKQQLEVHLKESYENNAYMVEKMKNLEKLVNDLLKGENKGDRKEIKTREIFEAPVNELLGDTQFIQELETMKEAFDKNQNLINFQEKQLSNQSTVISDYETFIMELYEYIDENALVSNMPPANADLPKTLSRLSSCIKELFANRDMTHKKLEALQQVLKSANRENALLNETVANLNDHIEELSTENDNLLNKFTCNHHNCLGCSSSPPISSKPRQIVNTEYKNSQVPINNLADYSVNKLKDMANRLAGIKVMLIQRPDLLIDNGQGISTSVKNTI